METPSFRLEYRKGFAEAHGFRSTVNILCMMDTEFEKWLATSLEKLSLNDEAYTGYIAGIVSLPESDSSTEDKTQSIIDFLSSATEENLDSLKEELQEWIQKIHKQQSEQQAKQKAKEKEASQKKEVETTDDKTSAQKVKLSKEEQKKRNALLARFAYEEEEVDENGDIILTEKTSEVARNGKTEGAASIGIERNENALKVKMEEQSKREKAKKEHEKKVQRDKEQRERELAKKEKEKKRSQKHERRRF